MTVGSNGVPSGRNPNNMQVLAYTTTEQLLYDFSDSEDFYVLALPPEVSKNTLYAVSPAYAYSWYGLNPNATVVYNPFLNPIQPVTVYSSVINNP